MVAGWNGSAPPRHTLRRRLLVIGLSIPAAVVLASWWFTEPLADHLVPVKPSALGPPVPVPDEVQRVAAEVEAPPAWPERRLDGAPAKALMLKIVLEAAERINRVDAYTATFHKQERLKGRLGPEQTLAIKVRQKPFAIYCKFLTAGAGKEVVYAEGHHDNKLIAHAGGVARLLVPRLAVAPDHPLALTDSRHPITEAGLANLTSRLIHYRRMDLDDPRAETVLDRHTDARGRTRLRSIHSHPKRNPERPFARVEVLYDPETFFPLDIKNFDWPEPDQTGAPLLAEHYEFENLNLDATLTALDFDPANPAYAFHRY